MPESEVLPVNVKRLVVDYGTLVAVVGAAVMGGTELRSLRLMAEANQQRVNQQPTAEGMEASILRAMRPLDTNLAEVRAELRALNDRVRRIEDGQ